MSSSSAVPLAISIHAPRTGSDKTGRRRDYYEGYFNPRSPHGERRPPAPVPLCRSDFNPRSPHGERRCCWAARQRREVFQSTLPARGATRSLRLLDNRQGGISIHAPRTGSDRTRKPTSTSCCKFQSTLPARGATVSGAMEDADGEISIHAPRTGSDAHKRIDGRKQLDFNPRSPHGERHIIIVSRGGTK